MVNQTLAAVCGILSKAFSLPVYTEPVAQGLELPSFFVKAEEISVKKLLGRRRRLDFTVQILYLPSKTERRRPESLETGKKLTSLFSLFSTGFGTVHGFSPRYELSKLARGFTRGFEDTDEVLLFRFDVKIFYEEKEEETEKMKNYRLEQEMKEKWQ